MASELVVAEVVVVVEVVVIAIPACNQSRATVGNVMNIVPKTPAVVEIIEQSNQTRECLSDLLIPRKIASTGCSQPFIFLYVH